jgi:lysophospholipase L1-like esterase
VSAARRFVAVRAALFVVEALLLLVGLEIAIRWARPELDVPHLRVHAAGYYTWYPHARFTYRNLPGVEPPSAAVRVNAVGLRGEEVPATKPPGERRVLVLGDSYSAAVQLPEELIFATLLERALDAARPAVRHRVLNAGVNGAGTGHEVLYYEHEGAALAPDVVILQYAWNDVGDTRAHDAFRPTDGGLELRPELRDPPFWREPLLAVRDAIGNRSLAAYLLYRAVAGLAGRNAIAADDVGVTLVARLAARLVADANAHGVPVVILTIPAPIGLAGGDAEYAAVVAAFERLVAGGTNQLIVSDTMLRDVAAHGGEPYLAHDGHLAPAGHRVVADALAAAVLRYEDHE